MGNVSVADKITIQGLHDEISRDHGTKYHAEKNWKLVTIKLILITMSGKLQDISTQTK